MYIFCMHALVHSKRRDTMETIPRTFQILQKIAHERAQAGNYKRGIRINSKFAHRQ